MATDLTSEPNNVADYFLNNTLLIIYALPLAAIWLSYWIYRQSQHRRSVRQQLEAANSGLCEPASLHPVIDPGLCLGCGACTRACPEGDILGLIHGKAQLLKASNCIGHGACKTACPMDAITLVFGSEKRGVDIPVLKPNFETNVSGIFIAGELGGMGLIRNAIEQGKQASTELIKTLPQAHNSDIDLLIVGAGPAGIAASLVAKANKRSFKTIDQDSLGGTVSHFPRNKIVMTAPVDLPLVGKINFKETTKEALLSFWQKIITSTGLTINFGERLESIKNMGTADDPDFEVITSNGSYSARSVLLCLGRRGTPRKLDVTGENLPKVVYRLIDPAQYRNQHVLIVGGGDSALEAATSIAAEAGTQVTISYRNESFTRAKLKNREAVKQASNHRNLTVLMESSVKLISSGSVEIEHDEKIKTLDNDAVIICAGGVLPTPFLKEIGVAIETKFGTV